MLTGRCRFDDNIADITEGRIRVGLDDEEVAEQEADDGEHQVTPEGAEEEEAAQWYAGTVFPLKVTDMIPMDDLLAMIARYREAYAQEEWRGQAWRVNREKRRAMLG